MSKRKGQRKKRRIKSKRNKTIKLERCCCKDEADKSIVANGLIPKFNPHQNNPKWIADIDTRRNCLQLGKASNYSHKLIIEIPRKEFMNMKQNFITKTNEPGSYGVTVSELKKFNSHITSIEKVQLRKVRRK